MKPPVEGIVVPMLTPFTADGDALDVPALRGLVDRLADAGVHGLIPNAGTSEFYHLDDAERRRAAEVVVEQAAGRLPVIVGAGAIATRHVIQWAKHAESLGAAGLLIMPPYYLPATKRAIVQHFAAVSEAVSTPIMLYNNPFVSGVLLGPDDIAQIVSVANIGWIKLTTKVIEDIPPILDRIGDRIPIFEGWDTLGFPSMLNGSKGLISATANVMPQLMIDLWRKTRVERNLDEAEAADRRLLPFIHYVIREGIFLSALKQISRLQGYPMGPVRPPIEEANELQLARVRQFAVELGALPG